MPTYNHKIKEHKFQLSGGMSISALNHNLTIQPLDVTTKVIGDPTKPVATQVTGDPAKPVATLITGDPSKPVTSRLEGNPDRPVATTSDIDIKNLPHLNKQDIIDILTPEIRVRIPNYNQLCFNFMGVEFFKICLSGESQVITEPYVPNAYERCELPCCEPDTRPFPQRDPDVPGTPPVG